VPYFKPVHFGVIVIHTCVFSWSNSLWPHGLWSARLLCPYDFPAKNTGVGCHFLLQGIFPTQGLNLHLLILLHCRQILYLLGHRGSPFIYLYKTVNAIREKLRRQSNECHGEYTVVLNGMVRLDLMKEETVEGSKNCAKWINIWGKRISGRGTAGSEALARNLTGGFEELPGGQCGLNRENHGKIIRDEVKGVPKSRSCAVLLSLVRILSFTLSIIGNHRRVEWRNHTITLIRKFRIGCREIIPLLFNLSAPPPSFFSLSPFYLLNICWTHLFNFCCHYLCQTNNFLYSINQLILLDKHDVPGTIPCSLGLGHSSEKTACVELTFLP